MDEAKIDNPDAGEGCGARENHGAREAHLAAHLRPLVVKIGSSTLTTSESKIDYAFLDDVARQVTRVREAGFSPICPTLYLPLFLNDAIPEEHKSGIDMSRDLLRRSHVLVVCGHTVTEAMKNDIAVAQRLGITSTTLEGILTVKGQGRR